MGNVLVILAHPDMGSSRINKALAGAIHGSDGVSVHQLYKEYPDNKVDVKESRRSWSKRML